MARRVNHNEFSISSCTELKENNHCIGHFYISHNTPRLICAPPPPSLQYLLTFSPMIDNLEVFNRHEIWGVNSTLINYCTKKVFKKSIGEFCSNRCFLESSIEITK